MKKLISSILIIVAIAFLNVLHAQNSLMVTDSFKVSGNCESCKIRIEKAAKISGVKKANWNMNTHFLIVSYNPDKAEFDDIQLSVVKSGHDTDKKKADDKDYKRLPACCKYRD